MFSPKTIQPLKIQHFIRMRLKTPTIDIAPVKLYPYVKKARRKLKCMSLRLAFARTSCTPYDTLCTYGVKQLKLLGFSRRYLFWFY